jgi:hypothetical protein
MLSNTRQLFCTMLGVPFKQLNYQKEAQDAKQVTLSRPCKEYLLRVGELKVEGRVWWEYAWQAA